MTKTDKAAQLREIAAKVRQVAGACNEEGYWKGCIAIGPLFKEAYEAGAWQREGSQIGDRLKRVRADSQELWEDGQTPTWTLDAYFAVIEPLTSHLMPPAGGKEQLELEAGIAADEIEEDAKRIEASDDSGQPPALYLGNRRVQVGSEPPIVLDESKDTVLAALIELGGSATLSELRDRSGKGDAARILKDIVRKHPALAPLITLPGGKGKGGYRTTIRGE